MARGYSPKPRILNRKAERHIKEATQWPERVTQSQEGLTQAPRRAAQRPPTQKSKFVEKADVSKPRGLEKAYEGRSILSRTDAGL